MIRSVIITKEEDWYVAQDVKSGVASQGHSIDEALSNLKEAVELFFDGNPPVEEETANSVLFTTMEVAI